MLEAIGKQSISISNMTRVATYVFIDLETTGIPKFEYNKTRITELSMVVVKRRHILDTRPGAAPRVQEKLTLCFNPRKMIHPESTDASGLCNDLLEHQTDFNMNVFNTISSFLQCFEKPVCLIAQNGHGFDFPILKNHFDKLGVSLPDDILCADSLHSFYDILELETYQNWNRNPELSVINNVTSEIKSDLLSHNQTEIYEEKKTMDTVQTELIDSKKTSKECEQDSDVKQQLKFQQQNERTPGHHKKTPEKLTKIDKVRRNIFYGKNSKPKQSYKLKDIYERVLGRPGIEAHRAENDCIMAMEIAVGKGKEFVKWVDNDANHCKFSEVNPMKVGVALGEKS